MAHLSYKDAAIKIDNAAGALTAITGSCNNYSLQGALNLLEDSGFGDDDRTYLSGLHGKTISVNGFLDSTTEAIFGPLIADRTSVTKTVELYTGTQYFNGETLASNTQISGSVDSIQTWSVDLTISGGMNRTSVGL